MKFRILCAGLVLCATVLTSGCRTTARRYACPPTVVGYAPAAGPCCNPPVGVVSHSAPVVSPVIAAPPCVR